MNINDLIKDFYIGQRSLVLIPSEKLIAYLHLSTTTKRRGIIHATANYCNNNLQDKITFCLHFQDSLFIPGFLVERYLGISNAERRRLKSKLGYAFSRPGKFFGTFCKFDYFKLADILNIKDSLALIREEYQRSKYTMRRQASKQAAVTRKLKLDNMPEWLKSAHLTWTVPPRHELKMLITIAKLSKEDKIGPFHFLFGKGSMSITIDLNGMAFLSINANVSFEWWIRGINFTLSTRRQLTQSIESKLRTRLNNLYLHFIKYDSASLRQSAIDLEKYITDGVGNVTIHSESINDD